MEIRRTEEKDLDAVMAVYARARAFMAQTGNPTQWGTDYPYIELIKSDIKKNGYVVTEDNRVIGVFVFEENAHEAVYDNIDGAWLNDRSYAVIHRCASDGTLKGTGRFFLDWCFDRCKNIRIDTHADNVPMKNLLEKNGYKYCGKIKYPGRGENDNGERVAYQKCSD